MDTGLGSIGAWEQLSLNRSNPKSSAEIQPTRTSRFNLNRAQVVDQNFINFVRNWGGSVIAAIPSEADPPVVPGNPARCSDLLQLFESQIVARHQDIAAREMRARNEGFYTIGSAGHEGNAVVGRLTRHTDMAFIHYRSGAFMAERARQVPEIDFVRDTMLSFAAAADDPIAGGRHKVWGSVPLWVPPQTSTIASHLPKAVGAALSFARAKRAGLVEALPHDSIFVCSFGDASVSHATAQTAFNAAARAAHQHFPIPILFVCEDNGIGISVETPRGWIEQNYSRRYGLHFFQANGLDLLDAYRVTSEAVAYCRRHRRPVFLHFKTVRLLGHAGSDPETEYHSWDVIEANEARDPLLASARLVLEHGLMTPDQVSALYEKTRSRVQEAAREAAQRPKLQSAKDVMAPLAPYTPSAVEAEAKRVPPYQERAHAFGGEDQFPELGPPRHMAVLLNMGLADMLAKYPQAILFGEDVARKGGVYHVTTGLAARFGLARVFNTVLDETTILGLAIGAAHVGLIPVPEIQYLAYFHNAEDQIRGEACSLQFFSNDQYRNPMVVRIAGWAYQKGFGGHFHNDNSIAALRDIPSLIVVTPARGDDAVKLLRTCMAMARVDGRVIAFIEPIALYMTRDLYEPKDGKWSFPYPPPDQAIAVGEGAVYRSHGGDIEAASAGSDDLTIITLANGVPMSLRAARVLQEQHGLKARVVDLRWLNPLNELFIVEQALATRRVLVVDEGRRTGGVGEAIMAVLYEQCGGDVVARRIAGRDTYIPLGPAADLVLIQESDIINASLQLTQGEKKSKPTPRQALGTKDRTSSTASRRKRM
jgi:2-oxoisovalerate dehydrogenase E1 component